MRCGDRKFNVVVRASCKIASSGIGLGCGVDFTRFERQEIAAPSIGGRGKDHARCFSGTPRLCFGLTFLKVYRISDRACGLRDESQDLIGGQRDDAEHRMAHRLGVAAHADHAPAELVFQARVDPLHGDALLKTNSKVEGVPTVCSLPFPAC